MQILIIDAFDDSRVVLAEKHWGGYRHVWWHDPNLFPTPATEATNLVKQHPLLPVPVS